MSPNCNKAALFYNMFSAQRRWTFQQQTKAGEAAFLALLVVVIPLAVGLQVFSNFSWTLSLVLLSALQLPSIIILYRWYLPQTLLRRRFALFGALLPFFIILYELNARLSYFLMIRLPFIPQGYQNNLLSAKPYQVPPIFIQNLDYTLLILLAATGFLFFQDWFRRQHTLDQLKADKLKLELDQLKAQIQPHFFFNTLNNLYALSLQGSPKTSVTIANLSGIMRYVLYEAQQPQVLLAKEIAFIHSYLDLERIRHANEDLIQFTVQGNPNGHMIEPLLFLPLIENCFKHSLYKRIPGNQVRIILTVDEKELVFQTTNLLATQEAPADWGGIGLQNVRKRLLLLYPGRHDLDIEATDTTFNVNLCLQING